MERLQKAVPGAHFVKAFSCVGNPFMVNPDFAGQKPTMFICGNSSAALPEGCVVGSGSVIGHYLTARLHVVISHDVHIEDFVFIGPGTVIGSAAHIECGAMLGAGVTAWIRGRLARSSGRVARLR